MIKKITIEAISIKPNKKDGTPYVYAEKNKLTKVATGKTLPRTMVSIKEGEDWYMGWSYKSGSAAETLTVGQTVEVLIEESTKVNPDGSQIVFKSWKFPKPEDKANQEIAELKARLSSMSGTAQIPVTSHTNVVPVVPVVQATVAPVVSDGSVPVSSIPF